ncbi:MAG TPA: hypothetical protein VNR87_05180 [Flavisolibacter sp.]|nr:hypothetical protein [Flavisolibacter sp.]
MNKKTMIALGIGAAIAATTAIYVVLKNKKGHSEKPPKKAPQVPVNNPGEQSEFATMASESEIG